MRMQVESGELKTTEMGTEDSVFEIPIQKDNTRKISAEVNRLGEILSVEYRVGNNVTRWRFKWGSPGRQGAPKVWTELKNR